MSPEHVVLVDDYAGLSDEGNDWGPAITAAFLDNPGCHVRFSAGEYVVRTAIEIPSGMLIGAGRGSTTIVALFAPAPLIYFVRWLGENGNADTVGRTSGARGLTVIVQGANLTKAFYVQERVDQYKDYRRLVEFTDLMLRGATQKSGGYANTCNEGALDWIQVGDCVSCAIREVTIWGTYDIHAATEPQFKDTGIRLYAQFVNEEYYGAVLTARISNVELGHLHTAVFVQDRAFYSLSHFDLIGTYYGIQEKGQLEVYNEPKVSHGNINAQCKGIWVENTGTRDYDDITIRRHSDGGKPGISWIGIHAKSVDNLRIHGCTIQPTYHTGFQPGPDTGIYLEAGCNGIVDGCKFGHNLEDCIRISNCSGVMIGNNVLLGNPTAQTPTTYLRLIENARRIHVAASPAISSTAAIPHYKLLWLDPSIDRSTLAVDVLGAQESLVRFTPVFKNVVPAYQLQEGRYTRVGRRVEFEIKLQWSSLPVTTDPDFLMIELPLRTMTVGSAVVVLNPFASTGLDLTLGPLQPFLHEVDDKTVLCLTAGSALLKYNSGRIKAAGLLVVTGYYWTS